MQATQQQAPRILIIAVYFGRLPNYFDHWLQSVSENKEFDFLLVSDSDLSAYTFQPSNLRHELCTFASFREELQGLFDFPIALQAPYKICDFRPAFGQLFRERLKQYEWWAHCDIDLIWGKLCNFFPPSVFNAVDRIQENGHLIFYRNSEPINLAYSLTPTHTKYREVFSSASIYCFDEWGGMHSISYSARLRCFWLKAFFDADCDSFQLRNCAGGNYRDQIIYWEDGHLFREYIIETDTAPYETPTIGRDEFMYIHLQKRTMGTMDDSHHRTRGFYITPTGFRTKIKREHCRTDFNLLNPDKLFYHFKKKIAKQVLRSLEFFQRAVIYLSRP